MLKRDGVHGVNCELVHDVLVEGVEVDPHTRCRHYHEDFDIVAVLFKCCKRWFSCYFCHEELTNHQAEVWQASEFQTNAIICGACGEQMSIATYLGCSNRCPNCDAGFNPGCSEHRHLYFAD